MTRVVELVVGVVVASMSVPPAVRAQTPMRGDSIHAAQTLFTWRDAALAAAFAGTTIAMFPIDRATARHLQDSTTQANRFLKNASRDVQYVADPGSIVIGVSMYGVGRMLHSRNVADLGLHGTDAVLLSGAVT